MVLLTQTTAHPLRNPHNVPRRPALHDLQRLINTLKDTPNGDTLHGTPGVDVIVGMGGAGNNTHNR